MKLLFWTNLNFLFFLNISLAQEVAPVVSTSQEDAKISISRTPVIVGIKTQMDSFGLDWNFYGVKPNEGVEQKFNKSMMDWLTINRIPNVEKIVVLDQENVNADYTHLLQWNLTIRKTNVQGKVQQFQLGADYFIAEKKNPDSPFYRGTLPSENRAFPADLVKQIPDVLIKSFSTMSTPHWQKIRQTLMAMQPSQGTFFAIVKNYKNISNILNLMDYWKSESKGVIVDIKIDRFDQEEAKLKVWYIPQKSLSIEKILVINFIKSEFLPFTMKEQKEKDPEPETLTYLIN